MSDNSHAYASNPVILKTLMLCISINSSTASARIYASVNPKCIGSDILSHIHCQAIIWANAGLLSTIPYTNFFFNENVSEDIVCEMVATLSRSDKLKAKGVCVCGVYVCMCARVCVCVGGGGVQTCPRYCSFKDTWGIFLHQSFSGMPQDGIANGSTL